MNALGISTNNAGRIEEKRRKIYRKIGKMSLEMQKLRDKGVLLVVDVTGNYTYDFHIKSCLEHVKFPIVYSFCSFGNYEEALYNGLMESKKLLKSLNRQKNYNQQTENCDYVQVPF